MISTPKLFLLIFLMILILFGILIYYLYKKIYIQHQIFDKMNHFEHFIQDIQAKKYELNEDIIQHIMSEYDTLDQMVS